MKITRLSDRVVKTDFAGVVGYVRQTGESEFTYTLKNFNVPKDESVEILGSGKCKTSREAFQELYREIRHYTLRVVNESKEPK